MTAAKEISAERLSESDLCKRSFVLAIKDAISVVSGKWRLAIVCTLLSGPKRFAEIGRLMGAITPRMLSKELRELELEGVVVKVDGTRRTRKYQLTESGAKLEEVIILMASWGKMHRALQPIG
jgi:DNA-binding HxlR family transcriptional regulator